MYNICIHSTYNTLQYYDRSPIPTCILAHYKIYYYFNIDCIYVLFLCVLSEK